MELQKNSLYARWYKFAYLTNDLPKSLCGLFWGLVFSIPFIVFSNPIWIILKIRNKEVTDYTFTNTTITLNIGFLLVQLFSGKEVSIDMFLMMWLIIVGVLVSFMIPTALIVFLLKSVKFNTRVVKDFKEKTCTLIKWK